MLDDLFTTDRTVARQIGLASLEGAEAQARDEAYRADAARLKQLLNLLDTKRITVRRFVRVACPARGTTLASGRLDRWLSVLDLISGGGIVGDVADFLLAVVKQRTDPRTLPRLEAMMPGSAVTRLLHLPGLTTAADLSVIAGDIEGVGRWAQLKLLAVDWFYGADHDLVVNTGSMMGGLRRPDGGARFLRDQGEDVQPLQLLRPPQVDRVAAGGAAARRRRRRRLQPAGRGPGRGATLAQRGGAQPGPGSHTAAPSHWWCPAPWAVRSMPAASGSGCTTGACSRAASRTSASTGPTCSRSNC